MGKRLTVAGVLLGFALFALAGPAFAVLLPPGASVPADTFAFPPGFLGGTQVASTGIVNFQDSSGGTFFTGRYLARVFRGDPQNPFIEGVVCAGCLSFVYNVENFSTSTDSIARIRMSNFGQFGVDAGYVDFDDTIPTGGETPTRMGVIPTTTARTGSGQVVTFNYAIPQIGPGQFTKTLIIYTDATNFTSGNLEVINTVSTGLLTAFQPTQAQAVPEPSSLLLLGTGLVGLGYLGTRRGRRGPKR